MTRTNLSLHEFKNPGAPTIVLLHPGGAMHSIWLPLIRNWRETYHLLAPDFIPGQASLSGLAVEITTLVREHCTEKVWLVGSSLGANVALLVAASSPHLVAGLVLDSAQCGGKPPIALPLVVSFLKKLLFFVPKFLITSLLLKQFEKYSGDDLKAIRSEVEAAPKTSFLQQIELHFDYDIQPFLKDISMPVLILAGENDILTRSGEPHKLQKGIRSSKMVIIPDAGHVTFLQQPEKFTELVSDFLPLPYTTTK